MIIRTNSVHIIEIDEIYKLKPTADLGFPMNDYFETKLIFSGLLVSVLY